MIIGIIYFGCFQLIFFSASIVLYVYVVIIRFVIGGRRYFVNTVGCFFAHKTKVNCS